MPVICSPVAAVLVLSTFTRPPAGCESAETDPANSRIPVSCTVAWTPDPTTPEPPLTLNRNVLVLATFMLLLLPSEGGTLESQAYRCRSSAKCRQSWPLRLLPGRWTLRMSYLSSACQ